MNNKDFLTTLMRRSALPSRIVNQQTATLVEELTRALEDEQTVSVASFGIFEVKKRLERVIVNPTSGQRMLVPPKLVVGFKPSQSLKSKI